MDDIFGFFAVMFWIIVIGALLKLAFWVWVGMHAAKAVNHATRAVNYGLNAYNQDFMRALFMLSQAIQYQQAQSARQAEIEAQRIIMRLPPPQRAPYQARLSDVMKGDAQVDANGEWIE